MKKWKRKLRLTTNADADSTPTTSELQAIQNLVLEIDPQAEFRETSLRYYDQEMMTSEKDRENFMEDLYDWADANRIWIEWSVRKDQ